MSTNLEAFRQQFDALGPWTTRFRLRGESFGSGYEVGEDDPLMRSFIEHLPSARRVLELGCMEGGRTFPLARRVGHVVGVDARREHLQRGRFIERELGVANVTFLESDLESGDLASLGSFDAVFNVGLLYHLNDPARLLRQCAEVAPEMLLWTHVVDDSDTEHRGYRGRFIGENPSDRIGGLRSKSFRPERSELVRMLDDCGWHDLEWLQDDPSSLTLWCRATIGPRPKRTVQLVPTLAVIITAHNYGQYLDDCLQSVLNQSRRPDEILVVDDASTDNTPEVDFDPAFYERLKSTGLQAKLCWDVECQHLANNEEQIMLASHWPREWESLDLTEYRSNMLHGREACKWIVKTLNGPEPAAIWGLSDGDVAWWCYEALARELKERMTVEGPNAPDYLRWLKFLADTSGLHDEDRDELWPLFDQACRSSPHWLVQHWWEPAERFTLQALKAQGVTIDAEGFGYARSRKRKIDCNAVYRLMDHGLWWPLLENKRLAIVSGHVDEFAARLMNPDFVCATGGRKITWTIATKLNCPPVHEPKRSYCSKMRDTLVTTHWDLLLSSAGAVSGVACAFAQQLGRSALDCGSIDVAVLAPFLKSKPH